MKKMKLSHSTMNENELSREQLKNIYGGDGSGSGSDPLYYFSACNVFCSSDNDCHGLCSHCMSTPGNVFSKVCLRS
ncbi:hypothetical protein [Prevotella sp.]|uniref:hypothetical protein n=1 Tax=Prevotella sp. TaxID=59823 RepID=UPI0026489A7B|nr:hypothetical protein [Prevotella sp.]MDN5552513.1 hypothetical protein [Prevotella sp.]